MEKILIDKNIGEVSDRSERGGGVRDWQRWTPYAAVAWSLIYTAMGLYWAMGGRGFPYTPGPMGIDAGPIAGRFGPIMAWVFVIMAGIPAAALGAAMLRGVRGRALRPLFITSGVLLGGVLLFLMTDITLLVMLGYVPYGIIKLLTGSEFGQVYLEALAQWVVAHQLLCLIGGFLWLAGTFSYARRSSDACLYCGRRDGPEGWTSPDRAARWGRIAVYVSMVAPVIYAVTRYAWALGIPLGISMEHLRSGQEDGTWISGLSLATFGLFGALLSLGLVQRWGEVFPRWIPGLGGRRVPIALAVVPASIVSVLLIVGGISVWFDLLKTDVQAVPGGIQELGVIVGPVTLFPIWGVALAIGTLGYYYRRRGPCKICGRGEHV